MDRIEYPPGPDAYDTARLKANALRAAGYRVRLTRRIGPDGRPTWFVWYTPKEDA